jgi:16S rRNA (cytosine967-C5)-methyltransferase
MTPAARIASAADILDQILAGSPAERALTNWGRANRFAGSGDRSAIRDHVFGALRCLRSCTALSGAGTPSGRALMIGALVAEGRAIDETFNGAGHAPAPLTREERSALAAAPALADLTLGQQIDCPDWLLGPLADSLGDDLVAVMAAQRQRADVYLRVNLRRIGRTEAMAALLAEGIETEATPKVDGGLRVVGRSNKVKSSTAYLDGLVELQDLSSQRAVEGLPLADGMKVLDFCTGGGGKSLAMAGRVACDLTAHDLMPERMRDLGVRAKRAGISIRVATLDQLSGQGFDLVLVDAPCSGSGTWRRAPDAKWRLTETRLAELVALQSSILADAAVFVRPGGVLGYMTCSILKCENEDRIEGFLARNSGFIFDNDTRFLPLTGGDGFFAASMTRV